MGEAKRRLQKFRCLSPVCIFCGGHIPATTQEHCPPRALFKDKRWPEGFVFPACKACNGGTSDDDLMVAFLAQLDPESDPAQLRKGAGLMKMVSKQFPGVLQEMFSRSAVEARADARRLGIKPEPGQTYQEIGVINVPEAMHSSVATLACKLTKAIYHMQTGAIFPTDGGIMFQWFTNAQRIEHGRIVILEAVANILGTTAAIERSGKDLKDQFDYRYSVDQPGDLHLLQVVFGMVFGFVTIFSQTPGRLEAVESGIKQKLGREDGPFAFINTNRRG